MDEVDEKIISILRQNPYGLTISELSRISKINRITLSKRLEILREKGYLNFRSVGKAKVWYINEDINFLELIHGDTSINKLLRTDKKGYFYISDIKFIIMPSEFIQVLYLQSIEKRDIDFVREIGKKFGISIGTTYKMYSGMERVLNEEVLLQVVKFLEKIGFGKVSDIFFDVKSFEASVDFQYLVESDILKEMEDLFRDNKIELKDYLTEGYLEGLFSILYGIPIICEEKYNIFKDNKIEFVIKRK